MKLSFSWKKVLLSLGIMILVLDVLYVLVGMWVLNINFGGGSGSVEFVEKYLKTTPVEHRVPPYDRITPRALSDSKKADQCRKEGGLQKRPCLARYAQKSIIFHFFE